jgi:DHA1 family bicyclomycin/chloramphenicol resistance-like MFS transporter/DHA1 family 2-module integral membrane pump EmrD-like MFS transporter
LIAVLLWYPETNLQRNKNKLSKDFILASYKELFSHPLFLGVTLCNFLSYGAYFSIFIVTPLLLIRDVGISPIHYGVLVCFGSAVAYLLAGYLNTRYVLRFGTANMMRFGWAVMIVSGILMWILPNFADFDEMAIGFPMILFFFGSTFIWPNAFATALTPFPHIAGYASVSYRLMLLGGGAIIGSLISYLPTDTTTPLACVLIVCSLLAWRIYEKLVVQK